MCVFTKKFAKLVIKNKKRAENKEKLFKCPLFFCKEGEKRYLCIKFTPISHEQKEQS